MDAHVKMENSTMNVHFDDDRRVSCLGSLKQKFTYRYSKIPYIRKLPIRATVMVLILVFINLCVWAATGIVLKFHEDLSGTAILAYTFGLRHALDADHISAIDLMTRRLVASNQRPVTVGTWFSLGHSTIVVITSIATAATASAISSKFNTFSHIGGIIGSSVSAAFLLLLGIANAYILYLLIRQMKKYLRARKRRRTHGSGSSENSFENGGEQESQSIENAGQLQISGGGPLFRLFKKLFRLIDRPYKMYPLGLLFGLGFDTSSEIALLGIASIQGTRGTSLWLILIFPVLFTAGMCLLDTFDGVLMLILYTAGIYKTDQEGIEDTRKEKENRNFAILYYNIILTGITVLVAAAIGILQILGLVVAVVGIKTLSKGNGKDFWDVAQRTLNNYDIVGAVVCGLFISVGVASVIVWKVWFKEKFGDVPASGAGVIEVESIERIENDVQAEAINDQDAYSKKRVNNHEPLENSATPSLRIEQLT